jgi:hypothetical protein
MDQIIIIISIPLPWEVGCMIVILIELTFTIDNHELPFMVVFSTLSYYCNNCNNGKLKKMDYNNLHIIFLREPK